MVQPGQVYLVFSLFTFQGAFLSYIWPALWIASCVTTRVGIHVGVNSFSGGDLVHLVHNVLILEVRQHEGMHSGLKYLGFILRQSVAVSTSEASRTSLGFRPFSS